MFFLRKAELVLQGAMPRMSPNEQVIYNEGERLIPGVTHDHMEVRRHFSSYLFFRAAIDLDLRRGVVQPPLRIVDLGCGVGHGCATLSDLDGVRITGVDNSAESLEYAREHYHRANIDWLQRNLTEFIGEMPSYEYVVSRGVIEHIPDGIRLVHGSRWSRRLMFDVPYDEPQGRNPHHVITQIREEAFDVFDNVEPFFQDLTGRMYARGQKPARPNMIMCCCRASGLPELTQHLPSPFCPDWGKVGGPACPQSPGVAPGQVQAGPSSGSRRAQPP